MASDTSKQNQQDQQAAELQTDQLDAVTGGRAPLVGGTRKPGNSGSSTDPCDGGE